MIVCIGQSMVDCIVYGNAYVAERITLSPGGEALNAAFALAALGADTALSSGIGQDFAGGLIRNLAADAGIRLVEGYEGLTPVSILKVDESGGRKSTVSRIHELGGYLPQLPEGDIEAVLLGSLFRPPFLDPHHVLETLSAARARGAVILADTKMPRGSDPHLSDYSETLPLIDIITPNEEEALYYTGCTRVEDAAAVLHSYGIPTVIIKLAERGVYVSECAVRDMSGGVVRGIPCGAVPDTLDAGGTGYYLPAFQVETADGIGAGDSLAAGLIYSLLRGRSLRDAVLFGEKCAAATVSCSGGIGAHEAIRRLSC